MSPATVTAAAMKPNSHIAVRSDPLSVGPTRRTFATSQTPTRPRASVPRARVMGGILSHSADGRPDTIRSDGRPRARPYHRRLPVPRGAGRHAELDGGVHAGRASGGA